MFEIWFNGAWINVPAGEKETKKTDITASIPHIYYWYIQYIGSKNG